MEQSLYWEVYSHSATEDNPHIFMEMEGLLPCSQQHTTGPYS
jgi:hypothetical protein